MQGMGEETSSGKQLKDPDELTCSNCGFSQSDFKKTGRFGCARCYQVFSEGLESLLEAMHKNTEHAGKVPSFIEDLPDSIPAGEPSFDKAPEFSFDELPTGLADEITTPEVSIALLKDQLDIAVSEEDYEEAARIRDEIAKIKSENPGGN
jgi:protein arginine kinase activator